MTDNTTRKINGAIEISVKFNGNVVKTMLKEENGESKKRQTSYKFENVECGINISCKDITVEDLGKTIKDTFKETIKASVIEEKNVSPDGCKPDPDSIAYSNPRYIFDPVIKTDIVLNDFQGCYCTNNKLIELNNYKNIFDIINEDIFMGESDSIDSGVFTINGKLANGEIVRIFMHSNNLSKNTLDSAIKRCMNEIDDHILNDRTKPVYRSVITDGMYMEIEVRR